MSDDNQDEIPTPRATGSWAIATDMSRALIARLWSAEIAKRSVNPLKRDIAGARRCGEISELLREMIVHFEQWPDNREQADLERPVLIPRLSELRREAEAILGAMGRGW